MIARRHRASTAKAVAAAPFAQALNGLRQVRGYPTYTTLADALGVHIAIVSAWLRKGDLPSAGQLDTIVRTLQPQDEALEALVCLWQEQHRLRRAAVSRRAGRRHRRSSPLLLGSWVEGVADAREVTLTTVANQLGLVDANPLRGRRVSLDTLARVLQTAPLALGLTDAEQEGLRTAVAATVATAASGGKPLVAISPNPRTHQRKIDCVLYNGNQVAAALGVSREYIRQLRGRLGIDHLLMTDEEVSALKAYRAQARQRTRSPLRPSVPQPTRNRTRSTT